MQSGINLCGKIIRALLDGDDGHIKSLEFKRGSQWERVQFRQDEYRGPAWYADRNVTLECPDRNTPLFAGQRNGLFFSLGYAIERDCLKITAAVENHGGDMEPLNAGIRLGIDTCMDKFPDWNNIYFPTLLRCESTHFWGYAMTPHGQILGIGSPDPVASWHLLYNSPGHRIYSACLDLLSPGPLPPRHPQSLSGLKSGERREWTVFLADIDSLENVKSKLAGILNVPMIDCDSYTAEPGQEVRMRIYGDAEKAELTAPDGLITVLAPRDPVISGDTPGLYTVRVASPSGKTAEATFSVRYPWSWYLRAARSEAIRIPQKASSHTESWYGFFSCFAAEKYFPDPVLDSAAHLKFAEIFPLMYDMNTMRPAAWPDRIQNHACAAGLLAGKYAVTGDLCDLELAAGIVDFLLTKQSADGAYRNKNIHYTSVAYIAKSIMEVMVQEKKLSANLRQWAERYQRHFQSVKKAMDNLAASLDNIETEGEMTYEDGMISCSCLQLAMFALLLDTPDERRKYVDAALFMVQGHRCLSQILIPDSRMNGCTLRFWESQYDILTTPNMLNSPHGWSAWRIYGLWYLYQLTGEAGYLQQTMNTLGSCVQLIDFNTGVLRWGFIADPCVEAWCFEEFPDRPGKGRCVKRVIGEQYLPMISDWYQAQPNTRVTGYWGGNNIGPGLAPGEIWPERWYGSDCEWGGDGGCCDNDVHEIFKCLAEVAIDSAYILETEPGIIKTWNCQCAKTEGKLVITLRESVVCRIHFNLKDTYKIKFITKDRCKELEIASGMQWVNC